MFDDKLDATSFTFSKRVYEDEFRQLMLNIYSCYEYLISCSVKVPSNNENAIRDILLEYLKDTKIRQDYCLIEGFRFDKEVDEGIGRVDIKIISINDFEDHDAYYIIECKRLDGYAKLNEAYVDDGIKRFTTSYKSLGDDPYYSSYYGINGMIGFIVANIDIDDNIKKIESYCSIKFETIEKDKLYFTIHSSLCLLHLMMDFSKNIKYKGKVR